MRIFISIYYAAPGLALSIGGKAAGVQVKLVSWFMDLQTKGITSKIGGMTTAQYPELLDFSY